MVINKDALDRYRTLNQFEDQEVSNADKKADNDGEGDTETRKRRISK